MKRNEIIAYTVALLAIGLAAVSVMTGRWRQGADIAAWVQAIGSIAAILVVTLPVYLQETLARQRARKVTLVTVKAAWGVMMGVAKRYTDPEHRTSEWWVPQWRILDDSLARCPIYETGSAEAVSAFIQFREYFARTIAFEDDLHSGNIDSTLTPPLAGFVAYLMTNAASEVDTLNRLLK